MSINSSLYILLTVIFILFASVQSQQSSCEPWPPNIPNLHDCCVFPNFLDLYTYAECMKHCIINHEKDPKCILQCYLNVTNIIHHNILDVHAVKDVYLENSDTKSWEGVIVTSINKCKSLVNVKDKKNLRTSLFKFFSCVKNESLPHCLEFYGTSECHESEKYFLKCSETNMSCSVWPERFSNESLINCCNFPEIFDSTFTELCEMKCVFGDDVLKCIEKCRYFDTGIVNKGTIDVDAIKSRMKTHRYYNVKWDDAIDEAVGTCLGEYYVKHANNSGTFSYTQFESCIDFRMSAECVSLRNDFECRTLKDFMENCPDTKPKGFVISKRNSRSIDNSNYDDENEI